MKKVLFIISLLIGTNLIAQDSLKQKELGMMTSNFNSFGLFYKTGSQTNKWRFQALAFSGGSEEITQETTNGVLYSNPKKSSSSEYSILCKVGREHCKAITPRFELFIGADLISRYQYNKESNPDYDVKIFPTNDPMIARTVQFGIGGVVGFNYTIANCIAIGAELSPTVLYEYSKTENKFETIYTRGNYTTKRLVYGFTSQSVLLCLSYRF